MKLSHNDFSLEVTPADLQGFLEMLKELIVRLRVPKNKQGMIGIIVAIKTSDEKERAWLESELMDQLHKYLVSTSNEAKFKIIQVKRSQVAQVKDKITAKNFLIRSRSHLIVYGSIIRGKIKGQESYLFRLDGMVRHLSISKNSQQIFSREFREMLPEKIAFPESENILGFELTQKWIGYVIKYIIGIAAFVSGDIKLARTLYTELDNEIILIQDSENIPIIDELKRRLPNRHQEVLISLISIQYYLYSIKRDKKYLFDSKPMVNELILKWPNNYFAHSIKSIILFFENKVDEAIDQIKSAQAADGVWHFSLGFLYAYKGEIDKALEQYRKIPYKIFPSNVCNDSEIFITEVILEKPELIQLIFFRGLLNYKYKQDYLLAKADFIEFLSNKDAKKFPQLVELAKKYSDQLDRL